VNATPEIQKAAKGLIADDDARMRSVIRALVLDLAQEIFEAANGRAAPEACFLNHPDWVTLELDMHAVDGLTALRPISAHDPLARIVIVTAHNTKAFREAARKAGTLVCVLRDACQNSRGACWPFVSPGTERPLRNSLSPEADVKKLRSVCHSRRTSGKFFTASWATTTAVEHRARPAAVREQSRVGLHGDGSFGFCTIE